VDIDLEALVSGFETLPCDALDSLLDRRDLTAFDSKWISARSAIPRQENLWQLESVFLAISEATGQHEITSYVTDDLELILDSRQCDIENEFVDRLAESYSRGDFPCT